MKENVSKQGVTVRTLILLLVLALSGVSPVLASGPTSFESFVKSREVIATLYFDANVDSLSLTERNRLAGMIQQLRKAQNNGRMIRVEGFSSTEGDQEKNFILSFFRARAVADIIEAEGMVSEIALTGYGDLRADSTDHAKERRVEVASYVKPVGVKRVKVVGNKVDAVNLSNKSKQIRQEAIEIDSYRLDQAIRGKVEDKGGFAEKRDKLDDSLQPGLSKTKEQLQKEELDRGYSLWRQSVDPGTTQKVAQAPGNGLDHRLTQYQSPLSSGTSRVQNQAKKSDDERQRGYSQSAETVTPGAAPGLTQSKQSDDASQRGYSQLEKGSVPDSAPGVTMLMPARVPRIDALMIEQAIMEKIGAMPAKPSAAVTQIDLDYQ